MPKLLIEHRSKAQSLTAAAGDSGGGFVLAKPNSACGVGNSMERSRFIALGLLAGMATGAMATGDLKPHPYQQIARQNVFRLQPTLRPESRPIQSELPPRITLQGIVCFRERKQVLFKSVTATGSGEGMREFSAILSEGESHGGIMVREINQQAGTVRFSNRGQEQRLSLDGDSVKPSALPALPPMPPSEVLPPAKAKGGNLHP